MTKPKMSGPGARKFPCGVCRVYRWTEQFSGVSVRNLTPSSVCDLCTMKEELLKKFEELKAEVLIRASECEKAYEARISQLEVEVERLRGVDSLTLAPVPPKVQEVEEERLRVVDSPTPAPVPSKEQGEEKKK